MFFFQKNPKKCALMRMLISLSDKTFKPEEYLKLCPYVLQGLGERTHSASQGSLDLRRERCRDGIALLWEASHQMCN